MIGVVRWAGGAPFPIFYPSPCTRVAHASAALGRSVGNKSSPLHSVVSRYKVAGGPGLQRLSPSFRIKSVAPSFGNESRAGIARDSFRPEGWDMKAAWSPKDSHAFWPGGPTLSRDFGEGWGIEKRGKPELSDFSCPILAHATAKLIVSYLKHPVTSFSPSSS